jgi:Ogr/Delta-like zinc finger
MRLGFVCPHCDSRSVNTRLTSLSRTVNELRYRCKNDDCGHVFVVRLEVVRSIQPSALPHPAVALPIAAQAWRPPAARAAVQSVRRRAW